MNANSNPLGRRSRKAFTLIELLVVIAIIAILAGMGAYVYPRAIDQAKKTRTKALVSDLVNAVKAYQLEYNRLPVDPASDDSTPIEFDGGEGAAILKVLIGENTALGARTSANPRETAFFKPDISSGVTIGMVFEGDDPVKLLDAWGKPIKIIMDADYNDKIPNPQSGGEPTNLRRQVIAWSEGSPSRELDNEWANNVKSWE